MSEDNYKKMLKQIEDGDYLHAEKINDIDYYVPNDENWFNVVAVSHEHKLIAVTDFCETDDFHPVEHGGVTYQSDYAYEVVNGVLTNNI